ncbi:MAG TPA: hypothetical protein VEI06_06255 [Gemmatimonadaceae bacterium]|nr:hypothetical protein [Gemmatimonadaceae bacterium]
MTAESDLLIRAVEHGPGIHVIRGSGTVRDWNGIRYKIGMSARNVGAKALSMNVATIPPGGVAYAHIHVGFEVMLYILEGRVRHEYGPRLEHAVENVAWRLHFHRAGRAARGVQPEPVRARRSRGRAVRRERVGAHREVREASKEPPALGFPGPRAPVPAVAGARSVAAYSQPSLAGFRPSFVAPEARPSPGLRPARRQSRSRAQRPR